MTVDPKWVVSLGGKSYPTWPGILDLAHRSGLKSIRTTLLQAPTEENGQVAIVQAEAIFEGDKVFTALGDASPRNVSAKIATALIRMAETRSKGRALRDGTNSGDTLFEELPGSDEPEHASPPRNGGPTTPHAAARERAAAPGAGAASLGTPPGKTGFEPHYSEAGSRHWARPELIAEVELLLEKAKALGIEKPSRDLEATQNPRLLAMVQALRQEIEAAQGAAAQAGAEGA